MQTEAALRHKEEFTKTTLGFWIYLMTDCVLFASLFATFAVLRNGTAGGPSGAELFGLDFVLTETILLLVSSLTDRKSTRLNSSHTDISRMPSSA